MAQAKRELAAVDISEMPPEVGTAIRNQAQKVVGRFLAARGQFEHMRDDLVSDAVEAALEAWPNFDPERGVQLNTYLDRVMQFALRKATNAPGNAGRTYQSNKGRWLRNNLNKALRWAGLSPVAPAEAQVRAVNDYQAHLQEQEELDNVHDYTVEDLEKEARLRHESSQLSTDVETDPNDPEAGTLLDTADKAKIQEETWTPEALQNLIAAEDTGETGESEAEAQEAARLAMQELAAEAGLSSHEQFVFEASQRHDTLEGAAEELGVKPATLKRYLNTIKKKLLAHQGDKPAQDELVREQLAESAERLAEPPEERRKKLDLENRILTRPAARDAAGEPDWSQPPVMFRRAPEGETFSRGQHQVRWEKLQSDDPAGPGVPVAPVIDKALEAEWRDAGGEDVFFQSGEGDGDIFFQSDPVEVLETDIDKINELVGEIATEETPEPAIWSAIRKMSPAFLVIEAERAEAVDTYKKEDKRTARPAFNPVRELHRWQRMATAAVIPPSRKRGIVFLGIPCCAQKNGTRFFQSGPF